MLVPALLTLTLLGAGQGHALPWTPKSQQDTQKFNQAIGSINQGLPTMAEEELGRILRRDPDCAPCRYAIARAKLLQNQPHAAYKMLKTLAREHPDHPFLLTDLAWAAFSAQRFEAAKAAAERAVAKMPADTDALRILVRTLVRTGELRHAQRMINVVRKRHDPAFIACLEVTLHGEAKKLTQARQALTRCREWDDAQLVAATEHHLANVSGTEEGILSDKSRELAARSVTSQVRKAADLYRQGRYKLAEKKLRGYTRRFPDDLYARGLLGLVRYAQEKYGPAQKDLEACLRGGTWIDTDYDGSLSGILTHSAEEQLHRNLQRFATSLTLLYLRDKSLADAKATLDRARRFYAATPELRDAEARYHHTVGKKTLAWQALREGLATWPGDKLLLTAVADLRRKDKEVPEDLVAQLEHSSDWTVLYNLAVDAQHADDYPTCVRHAEAARKKATQEKAAQTDALAFHCAVEARDLAVTKELLALDHVVSRKPGSVLRHAWFLSEEGKTREALNAVLRLPDQGEQRIPRRAAAARYHADLGELEQARALLEDKGADPEALYHVGVAFHNRGRVDEARALFERACKKPRGELVEACRDQSKD